VAAYSDYVAATEGCSIGETAVVSACAAVATVAGMLEGLDLKN
jgi:hypothetical protein